MNEQSTARTTGHDEDFYAWTQEQAKLLRAAERLGHVPAELDLAHVAEEIEDLGKAELRGATSLLRQIMIHLIKAASEPRAAALAHWRTEAKSFHVDLLAYFEPSMRQRMEVQSVWCRAVDLADSALRERGARLSAGIPDQCPYKLDDFISEDFDFDAAAARLDSRSDA